MSRDSQPYATLPFAVFLSQVMEARKISPKTVETASHINERLIRAWRSGERLPSLESGYLSDLAKALGCGQKELEARLRQSLQQVPRKSTGRGQNHRSQQKPLPKPAVLNPLDVDQTNPLQDTTGAPPPQKVTRGKEALNKAMIAMIQSLGQPADDINNRILIYFHSKEVVFEQEYREQWHESLRGAIQNGWFIDHLIQFSRNNTRTLITISNILRFISDKDQYALYKFKHKKPVDASDGMLVIPGRSAMICCSTSQPEFVDEGIFFQAAEDGQVIEVYTKHFELLKQQAELVYRKFDNYQQEEVLQAFMDSDNQAGDRTVILKRISEVTRPEEFYKMGSSWSKAIQKYYKFSPNELQQHLKTRKERHDKFRSVIKGNRCRYIYYAKCLKEFVETGKAYPYYFQATEQERLEQLIETKKLILAPESNNNFELAIIHDAEENIIGDIKPSFCEVKSGVITILEVPTGIRDEDGNLQHKWFLIEDSAITTAFQDYLSDVWDRLREDSKGLSALRWLNQQINTLEDQLRIPRSL
jgi:hypothetical protein